MARQTFAEYLINKILEPVGIKIDKPVNSKELGRILEEVFKKKPEKYGEIATALKALGDKFATWESITIGLDEIEPNYKERDKIFNKYRDAINNPKSKESQLDAIVDMQDEIKKLNVARDDDATLMVESAMSGKAGQLSKIRVAPLFQNKHGKLVPELIDRSYAEGLTPYQNWLNAEESRKNITEGQTSTQEPGVISKLFSAVLADVVISEDDCGTHNGIELNTKDEAVIDRYLAHPVGNFKYNTLITSQVQQELLRNKVEKIVVRSPQTCEAPQNTVCAKCYGLSINHGKPVHVGDPVGMITAGNITEPATQMALSSKHAITTATKEEGLRGIKGLIAVTELPKIYPDKMILCEVYGEVFKILPAPQGGKNIIIKETRPVPSKYIKYAEKYEQLHKHWLYYIPMQRKVIVKEKDKVYPGQPLTDGNENIQETARLRGLGAARSQLVENISTVYRNTGVKLDRRHSELLAKSMVNYVQVDKVPKTLTGITRGDIIDYNTLTKSLSNIKKEDTPIDEALGMSLAEPFMELSVGTELTEPHIQRMKALGKKTVKVYPDVEVSPYVKALPQIILERNTWLSNLGHRYLKDTIKDAASTNKQESIHGYNPIASYAYGAEFGQGINGRY